MSIASWCASSLGSYFSYVSSANRCYTAAHSGATFSVSPGACFTPEIDDGVSEAEVVSSPLIVMLDGSNRYFRAAVLKSRGYRVFTTEHVVEVCLRWAPGGCAALVIGPQVHWQDVATLCEWIKINSPEKPVILLSDRRNLRMPAHVDAVVSTQPVQALLESLHALLSASGEQPAKMTAGMRNSPALRLPPRLYNS